VIKTRIYAAYAYSSELDGTGFGWELQQWDSMVVTFIVDISHLLQTMCITCLHLCLSAFPRKSEFLFWGLIFIHFWMCSKM